MDTTDIEKLKADLKADLKAEILKELTGKAYKADNSEIGPLSEVRKEYKKRLYELYGSVWYAQVWECIRKLSCSMTGVRYVRDLTPSLEEKAAEYAKVLCDMAVNREREGRLCLIES